MLAIGEEDDWESVHNSNKNARQNYHWNIVSEADNFSCNMIKLKTGERQLLLCLLALTFLTLFEYKCSLSGTHFCHLEIFWTSHIKCKAAIQLWNMKDRKHLVNMSWKCYLKVVRHTHIYICSDFSSNELHLKVPHDFLISKVFLLFWNTFKLIEKLQE